MPAAGDFETWELLGRNAYGAVYRGVQFSLKRDVAIFELDAPLRKEAEQSPRFWDEVTQLAQLTDDALVAVYAVDRKAGWIVMELTAGNCGQLLTRPQPVDVARSILKQALSGLRRLHESNRTHGDIRPQTLLIHRGGRIKLSFALSAAMNGGLPYQRRDMKYVAPELVSPAFGEFGPRADLYCLGVSVVELLFGAKFAERFAGINDEGDAASRTAWMRWHADESAKLPSVRELLPNVPEEFAAVLDRLLKKKAADRYPTAAEALAAMAEAPLVPVIAPGVDPNSASGGAALVGDVDKLHDPASRFDVAAADDGHDADAVAAARAKATSNNQRKQVAAPGKAGGPKPAKKKSNLPAMLVGLGFAAVVAWIIISDQASTSTDATAPETVVAATELKFVPLERVTIPEDRIWTTKISLANPTDAKGAVKFRLVSQSLPGAEMDVDGTLLWLPTEEQGPSEVKLEYEASDESTPPKTVRGTTIVTVAETNRIPALVVPIDPPAVIGQPFTAKMTATDEDLPPNKLRFVLENGPSGATLDPQTGELSWTPDAATKPGVVEFSIAAEDDGTPPERGRRSMAVIVSAGNRPPAVEAIAEQTVTLPYDAELGDPAVELRVRAVDPDDLGALPRFALVEPALPGAQLDPRTGTFTLKPESADALKPGTYPVTVEVFDQGTPPASTRQTFQIVVRPAEK